MTIKRLCPICKADYTGKDFCPQCGLPWEVNYIRHHKEFHWPRPENRNIKDFQLCPFCQTPNEFGAHYCRNCGKNIHSQAMDKNGHQWVDLGLSVLWSSESLEGYYYWRDSKKRPNTPQYNYISSIRDGKDAATEQWGPQWRTPTKEEFEELIVKCKWEKSLGTYSNELMLKIIGPNGNQIFFSAMIELIKIGDYEQIDNSLCGFWTSSKGKFIDETSKTLYEGGYAFRYRGFKGFYPTLTAKQKKEEEFKKAEFYSRLGAKDLSSSESFKQSLEHKKILDAMGDDWKEREENRKRDNERKKKLWMETPIEMNLSDDVYMQGCRTVLVENIELDRLYKIHPVADKKWQGYI